MGAAYPAPCPVILPVITTIFLPNKTSKVYNMGVVSFAGEA